MKQGQCKAPSHRQLRIGDEIRVILSWILKRGNIRDEVIAQASLTVTEVRISPDLRNATVFFTPFGGGDPRPLQEALHRVAPFLRREMARQLTLRYVPALSFQPDESFDHADALDAVFRRPEVQRDLVVDESVSDGQGGTDCDGA